MSDYDIVQLSELTTPKARKAHRCQECEGIIPKGEVYTKVSYLFDGAFGECKTCTDCEALSSKYNIDTCFGGVFDYVLESGIGLEDMLEIMTRRQSSCGKRMAWLREAIAAADAVEDIKAVRCPKCGDFIVIRNVLAKNIDTENIRWNVGDAIALTCLGCLAHNTLFRHRSFGNPMKYAICHDKDARGL